MPVSDDQSDRLSRLEAVVESLADGQRQQGHTLDAIQNAVNSQGRISWPLVVSVVGMIGAGSMGTLTLAVTLGAMALAPMRVDIDHLADGKEANRERINDHAERLVRLETRAEPRP